MMNLVAAIDVDHLIHADLARIYGVTTKRLNEQVRRNKERFPEDFMFQLASSEVDALNRSHFATGSQKHRDPRSLPLAFTEHGAVMLASVLRSSVAIEASINVVRAFNRLRQLADKHKDLASALEKLERELHSRVARSDARLDDHAKNIKALFAAIDEIMEPPLRPKKRVGFTPG